MANKVFFIADTHFHHAKIIEYCHRPFKDVEEMNYKLIQNWNNTVGHDDIVYMLGDFCLGNKEKVSNMAYQLNGRKMLICGNHDAYRATDYMQLGFEWASRHPIIWNNYMILSHEPVFLEANSCRVNIHGHLHIGEHRIFKHDSDKNLYYNVSVEQIDYKPISIHAIEKHYAGISFKSRD